jgi:hypothetical protein
MEKGPDGRPLFKSPLIGPGKTTVVEGTEYLSPGTYPFVCSVHSHQLTPMKGKLTVVDDGRLPVARPAVDVSLPSRPFREIRKQNLLSVTIEANQSVHDVLLVAEEDGRKLGAASVLSLEPGVPQTVGIALRSAGWRTLRDAGSAVISVSGSARFGAADTARRRFH